MVKCECGSRDIDIGLHEKEIYIECRQCGNYEHIDIPKIEPDRFNIEDIGD